MAKWLRWGMILALCASAAGCDPCGGPLRFKQFPKVCDYGPSK